MWLNVFSLVPESVFVICTSCHIFTFSKFLIFSENFLVP